MNAAPAILADLHARPAVAVEVFHALRVGEAWVQTAEEWRRYSLAFTGELDAYGKEVPIARTFLGPDGRWHVAGSDASYLSAHAAKVALDAALINAGWSLVDPVEAQW